jgi:hypothetical protein
VMNSRRFMDLSSGRGRYPSISLGENSIVHHSKIGRRLAAVGQKHALTQRNIVGRFISISGHWDHQSNWASREGT